MGGKSQEISFRDITVVVQGPVVGQPSDKVNARQTNMCLQSLRRFLPGATIILSTWEGSSTQGLDFDQLILNKDPGDVKIGGGAPNAFRQTVSSINGLKLCRTKYAMKFRSDFELKGTKFLDYFINYNQLPFDPEYKMLQSRVVMLTSVNPRRKFKMPFQLSDMFVFGLTEDVTNVFNSPLAKTQVVWLDANGVEHTGDSVYSPYSIEQFIWFSLFSRHKHLDFKHNTDATAANIEASERFIANNCIFLTARQAEMNWLKLPGAAYTQIPCLSNTGLYTFTEYKKLLNKYANGRLLIIPNIPEDLVYFVVFNSRFFFKEKTPALHNFIARLIHPQNHKRVYVMRNKTK